MVTLTYGQSSASSDCNDSTGWAETEVSLVAALTIDNGDYFKIEGTPNDAGNEYAYYEKDVTNFSTTTYNNYLIRWKTSVASSGLGALVKAITTDPTTENLLDAGGVPQYSTTANTWMLTTGTLTSGKTLDKIQVFADDFPSAVDSGTYQVYYDFIIFYAGTFTLPNTAYGMRIDFPPKEAILGIPGRDTDITQMLGTENAEIHLGCDLDQGTWKRGADTIDGEVFLDMLHNRRTQPWQWIDTGQHQFKVSVHPSFGWRDKGDGGVGSTLDLVLKEYSLGDKSEETYKERYGIGL